MKSGVTIVKNNASVVIKGIRSLANRQVLVGVPSSTAGRGDGPITNAVLGYIHEHGSPSQNIPARPFLVPGVASVQGEIIKRLRGVASAAMAGRASAAENGRMAVGLVAASAVQKKITDGPFEPLAPSTIAARKRRGATRTKPLIDTGQLRQAITYVIRNRGN